MKPLQRHDNLAGTSHPAGQIGDGQPAIVNDCLIAQPTVAHIHTSMTGDRDHRRARRPSRRQPGLGILENQTLTSTRRIAGSPTIDAARQYGAGSGFGVTSSLPHT